MFSRNALSPSKVKGGGDDVNHNNQLVLQRKQSAAYTVENSYLATTVDNEDHTFNGIMFNICIDSAFPIRYIELHAFSARGRLGPITIWVTKENQDFRAVLEEKESWQCVYQHNHTPSTRKFVEFFLDSPIRLEPNETRGVYIHSALPNDRGIVYDNSRMWSGNNPRVKDDFIQVSSAYAHTSYDPFSPYGMWGNSWRQRREFVGTVRYGVKYMLWNPETHTRMPNTHQEVVMTLLLCSRRQTCILSILPLDCVLYILNMLAPWDYSFNESVKGRKRLKNRNGNNNSSYGGRIKNVF
jgi:hypothetical protein